MHFVVSNRRFDVFIHPRPIIRKGEPKEAWCDHVAGRILISCEVPREQRRVQLLHELRHAWVNMLGKPADDPEAEAASVAAFTDEMMSQYGSQGGDEALLALNPPPDSVPASSSGRMIRDRQACGRCQADVMCGSILNDAATWSDDLSCWAMRRGMICPACDALTVWHEQCTEKGTPLGVVLSNPAPEVPVGNRAREWVIEHEDRLLMLSR